MLKIIGIGNILRGDDGIGPGIISELKKIELPGAVEVFEMGTDAFSLVEHLIGEIPLLVIDCADMGKKPGEFFKFEVNEENLNFLENTISLHGFGFGDVYKMANSIRPDVKCTIIGVQPKSIDFNKGLSEEVKKSMPLIIQMVIEETNKYVQKNSYH